MSDLASRLRLERLEYNLTLAQAATESGVPAQTLNRIERGENTPYERTRYAIERWLARRRRPRKRASK